MAKMRKEYDPNKVKQRKRKPIIYIICEGKETEVLYFKHFRTRNCLVDIVPMTSKYTAAEHLVKNAKGLLSHADKNGYKIVYSNPSFEYWYLLHFVKHNGYLKGSNAVIEQLKKKDRLEKYEKSTDVFDALLPHQTEAIERAKERVQQLEKDNIIVLSSDSNPVTTVNELVEYLNSQQFVG